MTIRWLPLRFGRCAARARVFAYATFVSVACAVAASRAVHADFAEGALRAGRELEGLSDLLAGTKTILVNGTVMNLSTAFTDQSPSVVLDRFEAICRAHPEFLVRALSNVPATLLDKAHVEADRLWRLGVVRHEAGDEGALTCFTDDRAASVGNIVARVRAFERSAALSEFGHFHYVYVKRTPRGTHVRAIWTEGKMNLRELFPAEGDAYGFDSRALPRPPGARRILSVTSANVPFALHTYASTASEPSLRSFYEQEMKARGWRLATEGTRPTVGFLKEGAMTFLTFKTHGAVTTVTATETSQGDTPTRAEVYVAHHD